MLTRKTPLRSTTPLPRKRATPRRWKCPQFGCSSFTEPGKKTCSGCGERRATTATGHRSTAEGYWSRLMAPGTPCAVCGGIVGVQRAHIIGKGANRSPHVMWHPYNRIPLCKGPGSRECHTDFDAYRLDREAIITRFLGPEKYAELKAAAATRWDRNWIGVKARLRAALAAEKGK